MPKSAPSFTSSSETNTTTTKKRIGGVQARDEEAVGLVRTDQTSPRVSRADTAMPALDVALACRGPGGSRLDPGALASLDLRGKGVNAAAPSLGSHLTSLAKLDLADNVLGNDCVGALASLVTLKHLSVANNSLNGDALRGGSARPPQPLPPGKAAGGG